MVKKVNNKKVIAVASASLMSLTLMTTNAFAEETSTDNSITSGLVGVSDPSTNTTTNPLASLVTDTTTQESTKGVIKVTAKSNSDDKPLAGVKYGLFLQTGTTSVDDTSATPDENGVYPKKEVPTYIQMTSAKTLDNGTVYFTVDDDKKYQVRVLSAPSYIDTTSFESKDVQLTKGTVSNDAIVFDGKFNTSAISEENGKDAKYMYDLSDADLTTEAYKNMSYNVLKFPEPTLSTTGIDFGADPTIADELMVTVNGTDMKLSAFDAHLKTLRDALATLAADGTTPDSAASQVTFKIKNPVEGHSYVMSTLPLDASNEYSTTIDINNPVSLSVLVGYDAPAGLSGKYVTQPVIEVPTTTPTDTTDSGTTTPTDTTDSGTTTTPTDTAGDAIADDKFVSKDGKLIELSGEPEAIMKRITDNVASLKSNLTSSDYKTKLDEFNSDMLLMQNVQRVTYPFTTVEALNKVYPYGVSSTTYGYAEALDTDKDGVAGETEKTTDKNMNKSVFELFYDQTLAAEKASASVKYEDFEKKVIVGMTKADYEKAIDDFGLAINNEYNIEADDKALLYKLASGYAYVETADGKVSVVKDFQTMADAKGYADSVAEKNLKAKEEAAAQNEKVTVEAFKKAVTEKMTVEDELKAISDLKVTTTEDATIGDGRIGAIYQLKDGAVVVLNDGKAVTDVKDFTTLASAQDYVKEQQAEAKKVTIEKFKKVIFPDMTYTTYIKERDNFELKPAAEYSIGDDQLAQSYTLDDGTMLVGSDGKTVTLVKDFRTADEAKLYAEDLLAKSKVASVANFKKKVYVGQTTDDAKKAVEAFNINAVAEYGIGGDNKAITYQTTDGYVSVGAVDGKVSYVEGFKDLDEAKAYAKDVEAKYDAEVAKQREKEAEQKEDNRGVSIAQFKEKIQVDMLFEKYLLARDELGLTPAVNYSIGNGNVAAQYNLNDGYVLVGLDSSKVLFVETFTKEASVKAYADSLYADVTGDEDAEAPIVANPDEATDGSVTDEGETDTNTDKEADGATDTDKDPDTADTDGETTDTEDGEVDGTEVEDDIDDLEDEDAELEDGVSGSSGGGSSSSGGGSSSGGSLSDTAGQSGSGTSADPVTKTAILSKYLPQTGAASSSMMTTVLAGVMAVSGLALFKRRKKKDETNSLNDLL